MTSIKRSFGSLYCPKSLASGIKKSGYGAKKRKKKVKKRRKPKGKKKVKKMRRRKPKKKTRRKPKKKTSYVSSMIKKYINPTKIQEVIQENPELIGKAQELRRLRSSMRYSTRELVSIAFCNSSSFINGAVTTRIIALVTGIAIAAFDVTIFDFCNARNNSSLILSALSNTEASSGKSTG